MKHFFSTRLLTGLAALLLLWPQLGRAQNITQADFTGVVVPQYLSSGNNSGTATNPGPRLAFVFRATVTNLTANTPYRYYTQAATAADFGATGAAGVLLLINPGATAAATTYTTVSTGSLSTAGSYATFTTNAAGAYTGWFGFVNSSNARFVTAGNVVFPVIILAPDATPTTISRRALNQGAAVLNYAPAAGANNGTLLTGSSSATPKDLVFTYDNTAGTGRPVGGALVEAVGITTGTTQTGANAYTYSTAAGDYTTVLPNTLATGVRRVEERSIVSGAVLNCNTDADGVWPSGANTMNPAGGTTAVVLTVTDTPLNAGCNAATPTVTATPATLAAFATTAGTPSATQTVTVGGSSLTASITVTAPAGYEVSLSATTGFAATATVAQTGGTAASTPVYVRLTGATAGSFAGNVAVTSAGATAQNVAVTGTVSAATPAPTITSFSPTSGATGATVTVTGTDFTGATAVTLNGAAITGFTVVNATTITFVVPASATSGTIAVTTAGGTATSAGTFTFIPDNPVPTIASLAPATAVAGSAAFALTVNGTGFISTSVVNFNGAALATTFGSATQLTAAVPASAVAAAGSFAVTVTNPAPGGGTSAGSTFTVTTPAPTITSFTPASGLVGTNVTVTGTDFTGATAVTLNGAAIAGYTVVNATTITFVVPAGATSGTIAVTTAGGTATSTGTFTVIIPNTAPTITGLTPATAVAGSAAFTLTVDGTGFISASTVSFNNVALTTTFVSATQLTAAVPASVVAAAGSFAVTVTNPAPGGGTSAGSTFTVTTPAPTITSFTPASGLVGTTVTVTGTDLTGATAVTLNGVAITGFTVVNATTITFTIPAGATSGTIAVTTPTGTATSTGTFTVTLPTPTIASLAPATAVAGSAAFALTVNGTGFISTSVVNFNGAALATTFGSATQLTAAVPATAIATAGTYNVTVANPTANQGGTSAASTFTVTTPVPTITSFTPTSGPVGTTVTVTGTDFTGATGATLNGTAVTNFMVMGAATVMFDVPIGATSGTIAVTTPGGTATSTGTFTVTPPVVTPVISALSPNAQVVGGAALTLTITGTGFTPASAVNFNSVSYTQTSSTATSLVVTIPASALATVGGFPVSVTNTAGTSNVLTFIVSNPSTAGAFENFEAGTKAGYAAAPVTLASGVWNFSNALIGESFADKFNGLKSARIRTGGFIAMSFDKPNGAGTVIINAALYGSDTGASFLLEQSVDGGTTYTAVAGAPAALTGTLTPYTFTVNRAGNVRFRISNTVTVTTTSSPRVIIDDISVSNYTAPANPVPTITAITPNTAVVGAATTVTLTGTGFLATSVVNVDGNPIASTFVSATQLTGTVPVTAPAGVYSVTVVNPTPGGGTSNAVTFTLTAAPVAPTITSFTPTTGGPGAAVTITGTNFTGATAVRIGSFNVPNFTVVNATTITLVVPNGTGSVNGRISVTTPGGTATSTGTFNLVSATLASQALPGLAVFPNPATDRITVALPSAAPATVALRDLTGRVVLAPVALAADKQLYLPATLANGVYLLEVRQAGVVAIRRIVKN